MVEFLVPLAGAVFVTVRNVMIRASRYGVTRMTLLFSNFLITAALAVPVVVLTVPERIVPAFFFALPLSVVALTTSRFFLFGGLSAAALSTTIPLTALAPLFITGTSLVILGERPGPWGFLGVIAIVTGSYLLRARSARAGFLEPFRVLAREPAARMMLGAALCLSVAAPFAKMAIRSSNAYFAFGCAQLLALVASGAFLALRGQLSTAVRQLGRHFGWLLVVAGADFLQAVLTYIAFDLMLVAFVTGIKGSNILMTALVGHLLFREEHLWRSIAVGSVMVAGIALLSIQS